MPRPLRIEFPDAWYHVMNRARLGQEAFPAREDYLGFIELLMDASAGAWRTRRVILPSIF